MFLCLRFDRARRLPGFRSAIRQSPTAGPSRRKTGRTPDAITTARQPPSQAPYALAAARPVFTPVTRLRRLQYPSGANPFEKRQPALPNLGLALFLKAISDTV